MSQNLIYLKDVGQMLAWNKSLVLQFLQFIVLDAGRFSEVELASSIIFCQMLKMLNSTFYYKKCYIKIFEK